MCGEAPPEAARPTATAASAPYVPQLAIPSRHGPIGSPFNAEALHMRHGLTTERDKARQARARLLVAEVKAGYALRPEELGGSSGSRRRIRRIWMWRRVGRASGPMIHG